MTVRTSEESTERFSQLFSYRDVALERSERESSFEPPRRPTAWVALQRAPQRSVGRAFDQVLVLII